MPIVIMKTDAVSVYSQWVRPHAVWKGTFTQALKWCQNKNTEKGSTDIYEPVKVKKEKFTTKNKGE